MLRIESYVTPIILSYVNKYIKNLKPEDSQVSLWGGDAVFNNLDLRLDVLEEELSLPFSFVNGHIHELRIHVPWTKLTSEPIVITINTIECILKLKDGCVENLESSASSVSEDVASRESSPSSYTDPSVRKKSKSRQEVEAPTSYITSLMTRIISNVSIVCNNLVLKYVEDDIVLSINVKTLDLKAVNENWLPSFIDVASEGSILRHLANLNDVTVCLDKRNASGKIENYQEPLLYRCSLSLRVVRQFSSKFPGSSTKYHLHTSHLHFSLSDTQLPMLMRLVRLVYALASGDLTATDADTAERKSSVSGEMTESASDLSPDSAIGTLSSSSPSPPSISSPQIEGEEGDDSTWSSWAWSVGTALLPVYWDEDEEHEAGEAGADHELAKLKHRMKSNSEFAIYVDTATWVFKLTESKQDLNYFGPTRMRFSPFLRVTMSNSYASLGVMGMGHTRLRMGVGEVCMESADDFCICGVPENVSSFREEHQKSQNGSTSTSDSSKSLNTKDGWQIVDTSGNNDPKTLYLKMGHITEGYLLGSLFLEENLPEDTSNSELDENSWESFSSSNFDLMMLQKTPALSVDFMNKLEIPSDVSPEYLARLYSSLEYSNFEEKSACHVSLGTLEVVWCSGLYHRLTAVVQASSNYDYTPYSSPSGYYAAAAAHEQPTDTDITLLCSNPIPTLTFHLTMQEPRLLIHAATHPDVPSKDLCSFRRRKRMQRAVGELRVGDVCPPNERGWVCLVVGAHKLEAEMVMPLYQRKVVIAASAVASGTVTETLREQEDAEEVFKVQEKSNVKDLLVSAAQMHVSVKVMEGCIWLSNSSKHLSACLLKSFSPSFTASWRLLPHLYSPDLCLSNSEISLKTSIYGGISAPQALVANSLVSSWLGDSYRGKDGINSSLSDAFDTKFPLVCCDILDIKIKSVFSDKFYSLMLSVSSASVTLQENPFIVNTQILSKNLYEEDPERRKSDINFSEEGKVILVISDKVHGRLKCLVVSGPENRAGLEILLPENEDKSESLLHSVIQIPKDPSDKSTQVVFTFGLKKISTLVDPDVLELIAYRPKYATHSNPHDTLFKTKISEMQAQRRRKLSGSESETTKTTTRFETSSITTSDIKSSNRPTLMPLLAEEEPKGWKNCLWDLNPYLQKLIIHIDIASCSIFLPGSAMKVCCVNGLSNSIHRIYLTRNEQSGLGDTMLVSLPSLKLQNAAYKANLIECITDLPVNLPAEIYVSGSSPLPWSASMKDFSVHTLQSSGPHVRLPILKPVTTTATISLIASSGNASRNKRQAAKESKDVGESPRGVKEGKLSDPQSADSKTLSLVLHADMSPVEICGSRRQVDGNVKLMESLLKYGHRCYENYILMQEYRQTPSSAFCKQNSVNSEVINPSQSAGDAKTQRVNTWVQWTVAKVSATLYAETIFKNPSMKSSAVNQKSSEVLDMTCAEDTTHKVESRLRAEFEDLTMAIDLEKIYSKVKCRITSFNVVNHVKINKSWVPGDNDGIFLTPTSSELLPQSLNVVSPKTGTAEVCNAPGVLPQPQEGSQSSKSPHHGFLAFTLTSAFHKNVHGKWNQLLKREVGVDKVTLATSDHSITEVDIRVQPMDCVLSPAILEPFGKVYEPWLHLNIPKSSSFQHSRADRLSRDQSMSPQPSNIEIPSDNADSNEMLGLTLNNQVLPLLYLHLEGVRIFLPNDSSNLVSHLSSEGSQHDMVMLQVSSVLISPQVDNPVERTIERKDIWKLAEQAGVLSLPGSVLDDREYQLDILGVSLTSGNWESMISPDCSSRKPRTSSHDTLRLMGENPALAWNNYDPKNSEKDPSQYLPTLHPIVAKFDTRVIFAPAIVYSGDWITAPTSQIKTKKSKATPTTHTTTLPSTSSVTTSIKVKGATQKVSVASGVADTSEAAKSTSENTPAVTKLKHVLEEVNGDENAGEGHSKILVAGHSLEINATTDIDLYVSLPQIQLLSDIVVKMNRWIEDLIAKDTATKKSLDQTAFKSDIGDSGVDCDNSSIDVKTSKLLPLDIALANASAKHSKPTHHVMFKVPPTETKSSKDFPEAKGSTSSIVGNILGVSRSSNNSALKFVPLDILLTGSKISVVLYDKKKIERKVIPVVKLPLRCRSDERTRKWSRDRAVEVASTESEPSPKKRITANALVSLTSEPFLSTGTVIKEAKPYEETKSQTSDATLSQKEDGYDGSEEMSGLEETPTPPVETPTNPEESNTPHCVPHNIIPLLYVCVSQPHAYLACHPKTQKFKLSTFDFTLRGAPCGFTVKGINWNGDFTLSTSASGAKQVATSEDFVLSFLETKAGDPDARTGVPPALFTLDIYDFLFKPAKIEVDLGRPIRLCYSESKLSHLLKTCQTIVTAIPLTQKTHVNNPEVSPKPQTFDSLITDQLMFVESISLKTSQIVINWELRKSNKVKSEIHNSVMGIDVNIGTSRKRNLQQTSGILTQNSEAVDNLSEVTVNVTFHDYQLKTLYHSHNLLPLIKTCTFTCCSKIGWMNCSKNPYLDASFKSEVMAIDLGPEHVFCIMDMVEYIYAKFPTQENEKGGVKESSAENIPPADDGSNDIVYQDDLRAGVFQYIDSTPSKEPRPYQVVFDNSAGIMIWCYPEPRALTRVDIHPVPFVAASTKHQKNRDRVACVLQFFDPLRNDFVTYRQFQLSESKYHQLELPSLYEKQLVAVATTWRVWIDYSKDESNSLKPGGGHLLVPPSALAACMRVDSIFSSSLLPQFQFIMSCEKMVINIQNHMNLAGKKLPSELDHLNLETDMPDEHNIISVHFTNSSLRGNSWSKSLFCDIKSSVEVEAMNYTYLTNNPLMESTDVTIKMLMVDSVSSDKPRCVDTKVFAKPLFFHLSQSSLHSLSVCRKTWGQAYSIVSNVKQGPVYSTQSLMPLPLTCRYILHNACQESVRLGQAETEEGRLLESGTSVLYCWRSHKKSPMLRLCKDSGRWKWSKPFSIETPGTYVTSTSTPSSTSSSTPSRNIQVVVTVRKVEDSHLYVCFSSLVTIVNCLYDDITVKLLTKDVVYNRSHSNVFTLRSQSKLESICNDVECLRARFPRSPLSQGAPSSAVQSVWSEPIGVESEHLTTGKDNLLVRLPHRTKSDGMQVWCRIVRQRVGTVLRSVIVLSPQFVVRSHLPRPLIVHLNTPATHASHQMTVSGGGGSTCLRACDVSLSHQLTFQLRPDLPQSTPPIPLHRAMADQMRMSQGNEPVDLGTYTEQLLSNPTKDWPYVDLGANQTFLCTDQPKIDLQIGFSGLQPLLSTVVVDIRPWALVVNHSSVEVFLQDGDLPTTLSDQEEDTEDFDSSANMWFIPNNGVFAPPKLDGIFRLGVSEDDKCFYSNVLQISKEDRWYSLKFEGRLPRNGNANICIQTNKKNFYITIVNKYAQNIQVMHLLPTFTIANNTLSCFTLRPMSVVKSNASKGSTLNVDNSSNITLQPLKPKKILSEVPILSWSVTSAPTNRKKSFAQIIPFGTDFIRCVQFGQNNQFCDPLLVGEVTNGDVGDQRMTFSLPAGDREGDKESVWLYSSNKLFLLTVHQYMGRMKLVLQDNTHPQLIIYNNTMTTLVLGEGSSSSPGSVESSNGSNLHFSPSDSLMEHCVCSGQSVALCLKERDKTFPTIGQTNASRLHIAHTDTNLNHCNEFSHGIDLTAKHDQFETVPGFCDVKVHIERVASVLHVYIDSASRVEVSARDIRTRIASRQVSTKQKHPEKEKLETKREVSKADQKKREVEKIPRKIVMKKTTVYYLTSICTEVSFILHDDHKVDEDVKELLRVTMNNFVVSLRPKIDMAEKLRSLSYKVREQIELTLLVEDAQIDNQLYALGKYDFPVVMLFKNKVPLQNISEYDPLERAVQKAFVNAQFMTSILMEKASFNTFYPQAVKIKLQPVSLYAEDVFFYSFLDILQSFLSSKSQPIQMKNIKQDYDDLNKVHICLPLPEEIMSRSLAMLHPITVQEILINPLSVELSVHASVKLYVAFDQTPLNFNQYLKNNLHTTSYSLGHNIAMHYLSGALVRAGWVVGSLELLGNPGGFARKVGTGVKDFVQLPYEGIMVGPWAFMAGMTHGSLSLVKHFTAGTVASLTNLASSVARNMDRLSLDEEHMSRSEDERRASRPQGLVHGLGHGVATFVISVLGGIGGLAHQPLEALMDSEEVSASSVMGGVGRGVIGAITKPIGGAADLFLHTGQGLLKGTGWHLEHQPRHATHTTIPQSSLSNSEVKLSCKLLAALPVEFRNIHLSMEATLQLNSSIVPVTVVLAPEFLYIICCETDTQLYALPVSELLATPSESDPTLLVLCRAKGPRRRMAQLIMCPERVHDYVYGEKSGALMHENIGRLVYQDLSDGGLVEPDRDLEEDDDCSNKPDKQLDEEEGGANTLLPHTKPLPSAPNEGKLLLEEGNNVSDNEAPPTQPPGKEASTSLNVMVSPAVRQNLVAAVNLTKRVFQGKGFIV